MLGSKVIQGESNESKFEFPTKSVLLSTDWSVGVVPMATEYCLTPLSGSCIPLHSQEMVPVELAVGSADVLQRRVGEG